MVIIQSITTRWTKASRGAPKSGVRASVPTAVALPSFVEPGADVLVHELDAAEDGGFAVEEVTAEALRTGLPITVNGVEVSDAGDVIVVTRLASRWSGWPSRQRERVVFRLAAGEWGRCVRNARLGGARDWQYEKVVVNVAHVSGDDATGARDLFVATAPTYVVNEEAHLR